MKARTFRAEKEFGLIVGAILTLLGYWWLYRGKFVGPSYVVRFTGWVLLFSGLFFPRVLVWPRRAWMKLAEGLGFISSRVILFIVFFFLVTPIGLVKRAMGWDPLHRRAGSRESFWLPYSKRQQNPRHYEKMF
jgi:Saxitoxin biosynthesis operon protein SxtJ